MNELICMDIKSMFFTNQIFYFIHLIYKNSIIPISLTHKNPTQFTSWAISNETEDRFNQMGDPLRFRRETKM